MTDTQTAQSTWTIDPAHSSVEFAVKHMVFATAKGRFTDVKGTITLDEDDIAKSRVDVEIDPASVDTHDDGRNAHLRNADFFDVETFPTITFTSMAVERTKGDDLKVTGDLTMHGVTKPVVLDASFNGQGTSPFGPKVISYTATTTLNRKDFGLNWNATLEAGGVLVSDDVRITIEIEANA